MQVNKILNCTPHPITIKPENGETITIPPAGITIRIQTEQIPAGEIKVEDKTIPLVITKPKRVAFLKDGKEMTEGEIKKVFKDTVGIIVSSVVAGYKKEIQSAVGKPVNVFVPNTEKAIRNEKGFIVAVPSLILVE